MEGEIRGVVRDHKPSSLVDTERTWVLLWVVDNISDGNRCDEVLPPG